MIQGVTAFRKLVNVVRFPAKVNGWLLFPGVVATKIPL